MVLILECIVVCFILLVSCVISIANGPEQAAFLFEKDVQDRVIGQGLITKEQINRNRNIFKTASLTVMIAFVIWAVYGINGARGFWKPFWQIYAMAVHDSREPFDSCISCRSHVAGIQMMDEGIQADISAIWLHNRLNRSMKEG